MDKFKENTIYLSDSRVKYFRRYAFFSFTIILLVFTFLSFKGQFFDIISAFGNKKLIAFYLCIRTTVLSTVNYFWAIYFCAAMQLVLFTMLNVALFIYAANHYQKMCYSKGLSDFYKEKNNISIGFSSQQYRLFHQRIIF